MRSSTQSYLKVPYDLRPAKQVERRMMVDGLRILSASGFPIPDYRYVGLGSVHFIDFVMFHKLVGIQRLTSVEHDPEIRKRVRFNRPYKCVTLQMCTLGAVIPSLDKGEKHILWMDYDDIVNEELLQEVWLAAAMLCAGSILMVTVDVEAPGGSETPAGWKAYYEGVAGHYLAARGESLTGC